MCGIEILLCCAAGGAAGCCAKNKLDKAGKSKPGKGVKGEGEAYRKNAAAKENKNPKSKKAPPKDGKKNGKKKESQLKHRPSAYEEYQAKYATNAASSKPAADLHRRSATTTSPGKGRMDSAEFDRLKEAQRRQKLESL